jgi:phenylacetate-CoA ligase
MARILQNTATDRLARYVLALLPPKWRYLDREFVAYLGQLRESETRPVEAMREFQFENVRRLVTNAYERLPFYRHKYDAADFSPTQLRSFADITQIPPLTKDELREFSRSIAALGKRTGQLEAFTSGTTGKAITIYTNRAALSRELASICYQWARVGYDPADGRVELRGFLPDDCDYRYFPDVRILRVNIVKLSESNVHDVVARIRRSGYRFLHGYPSALYKFAKLLEAKSIELRPDALMMASEVVYDWQLTQIERVFPRARKIAHYGQAEHVALGAWETTRGYHFIPSYGLCENGPGGEIIGTGFTNDVMPLIRYRTSDVATGFNAEPQGRATLFPVVAQVLGRQEDMTYTVNGDIVPPAIVTFPFKQLSQVRAAKLIQHELSRFQLILESNGAEVAQDDENALLVGLRAIYGSTICIDVEHTAKIATDASGKFRWIECRLPERH